MKLHLISQFLDDELALQEKVAFTDAVGADPRFYEETKSMLEQELLLSKVLVENSPAAPQLSLRLRLKMLLTGWRPAAAGFIAAVLVLIVSHSLYEQPVEQVPPGVARTSLPHRFVIYLPEVKRAAVAGTFSDWQPLPMQRVGESGYWELRVKLEAGEYRYNYLVDRGKEIPDPTVHLREQDDFGGESTIISVGDAI